MEKNIQTKEYTINYYDIDYKKRALITSIINYFQDIAVLQSHNLGLTIDKLYELKTVWVLHKWEINIEKYPELYDTVTVETWPDSVKRFYAYRTFRLLNEEEEVIGNASSIWFLINIEKRKPARVPDEFFDIYGIPKDAVNTNEEWTLSDNIRTDRELEFKVKYLDIDTNLHVNNVRYIDWALETVPIEIIKTKELKKLRAVYEKEVSYGDTIRSVSEINESNGTYTINHVLYGSKGEKITLIQSTWC